MAEKTSIDNAKGVKITVLTQYIILDSQPLSNTKNIINHTLLTGIQPALLHYNSTWFEVINAAS